jgi:hypothetical protein
MQSHRHAIPKKSLYILILLDEIRISFSKRFRRFLFHEAIFHPYSFSSIRWWYYTFVRSLDERNLILVKFRPRFLIEFPSRTSRSLDGGWTLLFCPSSLHYHYSWAKKRHRFPRRRFIKRLCEVCARL